VVLRYKATRAPVRLPGSHRLWRRFPDAFDFVRTSFRFALQPRPACKAVWAPPLSLATTQGIVSFPPGTEMFQFPRFPSYEYGFLARCAGLAPARVSPFGHLRLLRVHTPHRSFSQCTTSFIGIWHQGIHRTLLVAYPNHVIRRIRCSRVSLAYALVKVRRETPGEGNRSPISPSPSLSHGDEGTRTPDFLRAKQALSQPELRPRLVGLTRLEQVTSRLSGECSNQLSYRPAPLTTP
jgi:hypothetical protein